MNNKDNATLADRLIIGLASGVMAIVTAGIVWILLASENITHIILPSVFVWGSGIIGLVIGFLTLENYLLNVLSPIWHFIFKHISWFHT
jgi:tetrahydromethanopterin S-methyltransferase subunit F